MAEAPGAVGAPGAAAAPGAAPSSPPMTAAAMAVAPAALDVLPRLPRNCTGFSSIRTRVAPPVVEPTIARARVSTAVTEVPVMPWWGCREVSSEAPRQRGGGGAGGGVRAPQV
ncbi:hypothetical protein GCM10010246_23210 [Streptomyces cuspidosporus]|uniref:Uncharacterized protein n=1 Tax=Streptomyces cuspidosporus TaxID=66882 RepID=A0ABP5ST19_9ACTN